MMQPTTLLPSANGEKPKVEQEKAVPMEITVEVASPSVKGDAMRVFSNYAYNGTSEILDFSKFNAAFVEVLVTGTSPSATITIQGSADGSRFSALPDPNATKTFVRANTVFEIGIGCSFVRVDIASISGTFVANQGYTIIVVPFIAPRVERHSIQVVRATGTGAISTTVTPSGRFQLRSVTCRLSAIPNGTDTWSVTLNGAGGSAYDTVLSSVIPAPEAAGQDIAYNAGNEGIGENGDAILVSFTNTLGATYGLRVVYELL